MTGPPMPRARPPDQVPTPSESSILYWIYAGRLTVAIALYGAAFIVGEGWRSVPEHLAFEVRSLTLAVLLATVVFTAISYWSSHRRERTPTTRFILLQSILDVFLVSGVVLLTGGSESVFPPLLYVILVSGYALVTPLGTGFLIALGTGAAYLAVVALAYPEQFGPGVLLQTLIFTLVAVVSSVIGGRLRQAGHKLSSLESELTRLRFGTADILRTIDAAVVAVDPRGNAVYLNPAAATIFGIVPEESIGHPVLDSLRRRAPGVAEALVETFDEGAAVKARDVEVDDPEHGPVPYALSTALLERDGAPTLSTAVLQDLRMARQLEILHLRASRLEVVAELSASLAHEIKNPLASIRSAVEQIADTDSDEADRRTLSQLVIREADRLSRLLGEFNDFARVNVAERKPIDLARVIGEAVVLVEQRPEAQGRATFVTEIGGGLDDLWGDPDLVHRTLTNLMLNAVQVSDPDGTVTVRVIADSLRPEVSPPGVASGLPVRIRVIDDGPGIAPEDLGRVFDPFYTRRQGGSGMGLAIAHRAVQAHGGALLVSSRPGGGATFAIILPRREPEARRQFDPLQDDADRTLSRATPDALDGFADRLG